MPRTIIAMGGGYSGEPRGTYLLSEPPEGQEFHENSTREIDELIVKATNKENPNVLLLTTASEDGEHVLVLYVDALTKQFESLGASVSVLNILTDKPSAETIKSRIEEADAVYVSGGDTEQLVQVWQKLGIDALLRDAYENGTVMSGLSAGASCWFSYVTSNSHYDDKPFKLQALGWFDGLICPHYDSEPFRQEPFKQMLKDSPELNGLALNEHAAIEIVDNTYRIHIYGDGAKAHKAYWQNGTYIFEEIKPTDELHDLDELLKGRSG